MKEKESLSPIESAKMKLKAIEAKEGETLNVFQAKTFLGILEILLNKKPAKPPLELAKQLQKEQAVGLEKQHAKILKQANTYADLYKMSETEKSKHIAAVEAQIKIEKNAFNNQWTFNFGLLPAPGSSKPFLQATPDSENSLLAKLRSRGYIPAHVSNFEILLCHKNLNGLRDTSLDNFNTGGKRRYDVVVNGTFFFNRKILGAIIVNGKIVNLSDNPKTKNRGALALLKDGSFALGLTVDNSEAGACRAFEDSKNPQKTVLSLMAGGVLIIKNGKAISGEEIMKIQQFNQPSQEYVKTEKKKGKTTEEIKVTSAWESAQLADNTHSLFGMHKGDLYLAVTTEKTGKKIQADLMELGFDSAIIFDGGSRCYLDSPEKTIISKAPGKKVSDIPCGFGIKIKTSGGK
ncbi:MAG TPA: phosphodiester glycosidase family protein [Candidatus Rifleibacterium sp.]|nr:phosphodiester glycosidase family protein [Candidatus Rifleibacterium sp.]HPT47406.1 phosphodiester glycosidase family protein [Candidatus Rifleibacterium sp.]